MNSNEDVICDFSVSVIPTLNLENSIVGISFSFVAGMGLKNLRRALSKTPFASLSPV
jgi:hypothetical protein